MISPACAKPRQSRDASTPSGKTTSVMVIHSDAPTILFLQQPFKMQTVCTVCSLIEDM